MDTEQRHFYFPKLEVLEIILHGRVKSHFNQTECFLSFDKDLQEFYEVRHRIFTHRRLLLIHNRNISNKHNSLI